MLLGSSTSRRTSGNRPSSTRVEQSERVCHSTTCRDARFGSSAAVLLQHRSCQPLWVHIMQKNVRRLKSLIYSSRTHHHPTSVRTRATTSRWLPTHLNSPSPTSATVMQWIITLINISVIQCTWRRPRTWWFELLTHR